MPSFEDKQAALSGSANSNFLAEAMVESEKFRADYATLPNVIKAKDMPWERSPDGLIKHLVQQEDAYARVLHRSLYAIPQGWREAPASTATCGRNCSSWSKAPATICTGT